MTQMLGMTLGRRCYKCGQDNWYTEVKPGVPQVAYCATCRPVLGDPGAVAQAQEERPHDNPWVLPAGWERWADDLQAEVDRYKAGRALL